jgi:hypothetical protein
MCIAHGGIRAHGARVSEDLYACMYKHKYVRTYTYAPSYDIEVRLHMNRPYPHATCIFENKKAIMTQIVHMRMHIL